MAGQYRADHVGSLLRPAELLEARRDGKDPQRLRELEDRHITRVLAKQKELGFEIFTDGEFRRRNFMGDFTDAVEGFDFGDGVTREVGCVRSQGRGAEPGQGGGRGDRKAAAGAAVDRARTAFPEDSTARARSR